MDPNSQGPGIWFQGNDQHVNEILKSPEDAQSDYNSFEDEVSSKMKHNVKDQVAQSQRALEAQIAHLQDPESNQLGREELDHVEAARVIWLEKRNKGHRKLGRHFQKFLTSFSDFLEAYSGIVEVVRQAGQPYGDVAYKTLSLLLIVAVKKSRNEDQISLALDELKLSFPRLEILLQIYPTPALKVLVANVHQNAIEFSRRAVEYYTRWRTRLWTAISPSRRRLDSAFDRIRKGLLEVRSECEIALNVRVKELAEMNREQISKINDLRKNLVALRLENHEQTLATIQSALDIHETAVEAKLTTYQGVLDGAFRTRGTDPSSRMTYSQMSTDILMRSQEYQSWFSRTHSSLLFMSGKTKPISRTGASITCSWLSKAAIHVAHQLHSAQKAATLVFFTCHPHPQPEPQGVPLLEPLHDILWQTLRLAPSSILPQHGKMIACEAPRWKKELENPERLVSRIFVSWRSILTHMYATTAEEDGAPKTLYVVLDRLDEIKTTKAAKKHLIREFATLASQTDVLVKVLLIMDPVKWGGGLNDFMEDMTKEFTTSVLQTVLDWDQAETVHGVQGREWL